MPTPKKKVQVSPVPTHTTLQHYIVIEPEPDKQYSIFQEFTA